MSGDLTRYCDCYGDGCGKGLAGPVGRLICLVGARDQDRSLVLEECPFCHKFLVAELLSKAEIDTAEALKEKDAFFKMGITIETGERVVDHPEAFVTSRFAYRCRDCGKEWTRFGVREVGIPGEYGEDDEVKTDYDAGKDEEDTKEEQYAGEG